MYDDMFDTDRIDKEVRRKVLTVVFWVLCGIIAQSCFGYCAA